MTTFGNHLFDRVISVAILEVLCFPAEFFWYIDYLIDSDSFGNQPLSKSVNIQKGIHSMTELSTVKSSAVKALAMEYKNLQEEPLEGFQVKLAKEESLFEWDVVIFGPPETLYQGGYFKAKMRFPLDYPFSPPSVKFTTKVWHPNIYDSGDICISILHPPVDDPQSGELPCERWNPTQTVRTILLSVVSLLNEPNTFSPANVDASVMYRRWRESKGHDKEYEEIIRRQVAASREEAARDSVEVPLTLEDYTRASRLQRERAVPAAEISDFFEDMTGDDEDNDTDQDASITTQGYENDQEGS